jgi:hypothetical protein
MVVITLRKKVKKSEINRVHSIRIMIGYTYQMKGNTMLNIKQIMQYCECNEDLAKKIEATMSALGFDFSGCTQEEFNAVAFECFELIERGFKLV